MRADAIGLVAALGAIEMSLVRCDPVAGPLLAQAVRAADGVLPEVASLRAALQIVRTVDLGGDTPADRAARKVAQALCRQAAQAAQAAAMVGGTV